MKQLAYTFLLAALLAGCAGSPSKEASIEDRGIKAKPAEAVTIVEAGGVKTSGGEGSVVEQSGIEGGGVKTGAAGGAAPISESQAKAEEGVQTSTSATKRISEQPLGSVQTSGVAAPSSEAKPLPEGKVQTAPDMAAAVTTAVQDSSLLPRPDTVSSWGDLTNPDSLLSKRRLLFDFDSAAIRDEYRPVLEAHAQFMKANKEARAILQGHTDERGSREYNLALGQRRAESVLKALNLLGVPEEQMEAVSLGEEKPVAEGHNEEAWQQNRRTEIIYQGE